MKNIFSLRRRSGAMSDCLQAAATHLRTAARFGVAGSILAFGLASNIHAAPVTIDVSATIVFVEGDYVGEISLGQTLLGSFVFDTDEANSSSAITTPSTVEGHEFTSFYDFSGDPYAVSWSIPAIPASFDSTAPVAVVVNDNLELTADDTAGFGPVGILDWIEILGSTTMGECLLETPPGCEPDEFSPVSGEEWALGIFANDADWISDGSVIPDSLPDSDTRLIVGIRFDEFGDETGLVIATVSTVPVPAAAWLFGSALGILGWMRRKAA